FTDFGAGSGIHVVSAEDGSFLWSRSYEPHGAHYRQARALFANGLLWIVQNRKIEGLDIRTGEVKQTFKGGSGHCYPPVATSRHLWSGELTLTDLTTGEVDENRITKGSCSRTAGVLPANGLLYMFPKGCVCWPMLKGFSALAPAKPANDDNVEERPDDFVLEKGPAWQRASGQKGGVGSEWPCYRHNAWRSASTTCALPADLRVVWQQQIAKVAPHRPKDWRENAFAQGVITAPVVGSQITLVAVPDEHRVVALDAKTGQD
ncbi:unnamed protein product, partial [marine sediment metagenome]